MSLADDVATLSHITNNADPGSTWVPVDTALLKRVLPTVGSATAPAAQAAQDAREAALRWQLTMSQGETAQARADHTAAEARAAELAEKLAEATKTMTQWKAEIDAIKAALQPKVPGG